MSITVMKLALEALLIWEKMQPNTSALAVRSPAIDALRTAIAEAEKQEPVACRTLCELCIKRGYNFCANAAKTTPITTPPAAQPCPYIRSTAEGTHHCALSQRQPLTDEKLNEIAAQGYSRWVEFARAIEAAHGIGENT